MENSFTYLTPVALRLMLCVTAVWAVLWCISLVLAVKKMIHSRFSVGKFILWLLLIIWTGGIVIPFIYLNSRHNTPEQ
ncbi:MAG: hypothetical protein J6S48_00645 [Bacteroidales bacterium]|nr:hypothetical protein [Bacteroidales bacterium]